MTSRKRRIALYSPGIVGLGHMRRHLLIGQSLANSPMDLSILMFAEARQAGAFTMTPGLDCLILPALQRDRDGNVRARYLDIEPDHMLRLRAETIRAAVGAFEPDVLIVDKHPRGAMCELDPTLRLLRERRGCRLVLGLRDVLDEPTAVQRDWNATSDERTIRECYDAVWVYGDPSVYDPVAEYGFPADIAAKVRYTGYFDQRLRLKFADAGADPLQSLSLPPGQLAICLLGGGEDGAALAEAFVQAPLPPDTNAIIVTGPFMPPAVQRRLHTAAATSPRLRIIDFLPEPAMLMNQADRIVAMGGYNTVCEVLSFQKQALIVPRIRPRREQLIRAERLRGMGLIDVLHPDSLTPAAISAWLSAPARRPPAARECMDFGGLARLPALLEDVLAGHRGTARPADEGSVPLGR